jgi:hypothetical protein
MVNNLSAHVDSVHMGEVEIWMASGLGSEDLSKIGLLEDEGAVMAAPRYCRHLHCAPPDFLFRVVALMKSVRLSEKKHSIRENARSSGIERWNPTSRQKRARYGAPRICFGERLSEL